MKHPDDGILLVDKAEGETSHGVVKKVRFALRQGKRYKVGHAGTLDPFATGLLVVLLGQGTKLSRFIMAGEKEYLATLELGVETDTLDPTGTVTAIRDVPKLSLDHIQETAKRYEGRIRQTPPAYSAVKHQGLRAYTLARKGISVNLKERTVTVHSISIVSVDLPHVTMRIRCGSGTYIRSLAADLAKDLGSVGRLKTLRRLKSGTFDVKEAISSEAILPEALVSILEKGMPLRNALPGMGEIDVDAMLAEKVRQGYQPCWDELFPIVAPVQNDQEIFIKLISGEKLLAIAKKNDGGGGHEKVKFERVFS
ncbi:MAG: tRNA pseudouridine(55) synthase TruB [Desulfobacteraceae bacterium 4572_87]|nr:MAG: tRNA pseudouridine(55) synthase TruB [Desulfobacteraceae bacterium 4572_87]